MALFEGCKTVGDVLLRIVNLVIAKIAAVLPGILLGTAIIVVGWFTGKLVKKAVLRLGRKLAWEQAITDYLASTCRYAVFIIIAVAGLKRMGLPVTSILTAMGISGIIIGLGLRAQISNYFAGVMMLAARPFRQGDLIEFGPPPQIGTVKEVCMTYTALESLDNVRIVVPNAVLWRNRIFNFSVHPERAIRITLKMPYEANIAWVKEICLDVLRRHEAVLNEPAPAFKTAEVSATEIKAVVIAWSDTSTMTVFGTVVAEMRKDFEIAGMAVTVPADPIDLKREE